MVGTDDQNLTLATNTLSIEDGNSVDLTPYLDNTDDQNISGSGLAGTDLTIGIEGGTSETIDLSSLVGTDDQNISGSGLAGTDLTIGIEGGTSETIDLSSLVGTDDQTLSTTGAAGNITIEDGNTININVDDADASVTNEVNTAFAVNAGNLEITDSNGTFSVPVASLGTDDQNISGSGLAGTDLTIGIEGGTSETIDLSSLVGTDDQNLSTTGAAGNITIEDGNTININVDDADASVTNEVNTAFAVNAGNLEITDSNGTLSVPVSSLGTDDQNLTLATNTLSIEDGNSVDLSPYLDNTDDQNISGSGLAGTDLTIGIEGGASETIDLSSLVGTDDQNISGSGLAGTDLTIGIEGGTSETIDLSRLVGTDDQTLSTTGAAGNITIEDGNYHQH